MAKLILLGSNGGEDYPLGNELTIGRRSSNTLRLLEEFVSRDHIKITQTASGYLLEDVSSKDGVGVIVNNVRLKGVAGNTPQHRLMHNDVILINDIQFTFDDPDSDPDFMPTLVPNTLRDKLKAYERPALPTQMPAAKKDAGKSQRAEPAIRAQPAEKLDISSMQSTPGVAKPGTFDNVPTSPRMSGKVPARSPKPDINDDSLLGHDSLKDYIPSRYLEKPNAVVPEKQPEKFKLTNTLIITSILLMAVATAFICIQIIPAAVPRVQQWLNPRNTLADVVAALKLGNLSIADKLYSDNKDRLTPADASAIKSAIDHAKRAVRIVGIRDLIKSSKFEEARAKAMTELSLESHEPQDEVFMLSDFATSALNVKKLFEKTKDLAKSYDLSVLSNTDANIQDALEEFAHNKQKIEDFKKSAESKSGDPVFEPLDMTANAELNTVYDALVATRKQVGIRKAEIQSVEKLWDEVRTSRGSGNWEDELSKLEQVSKSAPEISASVTKGQRLDTLIASLRHALAAKRAIVAKQFATAAVEIAALSSDDPHRAGVEKLLADASKKARIQEASTLHMNGNSAEALAVLKDARPGEEDGALLAHITKVGVGWAALKDVQAARISENIIKESVAFLSILDERDAYFKIRAEAVLAEARHNVNMLKFARLKQLFVEKKFDAFRIAVEPFLAEVDRIAFADLHDEAAKLKAQSDDWAAEKAAASFKEGSDYWDRYMQNRITPKDRANIDPDTLEKYAKQIKWMSEAWTRIREAQQLSGSVKPKLRAAIQTAHDLIVAEVIFQANELFTKVRQAGQLVERSDYVKVAEDRILMLPDVPNNTAYQQMKAARK